MNVHPTIASLIPYSPGKPLEELEREFGIQNAVKLASNENPLGPSPKAQRALAQAAGSLHRYPEGSAYALRRALAQRWGVEADHIIVGNGSDEIISLLVRAFLSPGDEAVMADQTFVMYKLAVLMAHARPIEVPLKDWRHDLPAMAKAITDRTRLVFLCNPNNPTGTMVPAQEVEALLAQLPEHVLLVCDEAYYEYVCDPRYPESVHYVKQQRPVVVLRTFSKIYGLAGLRVGYGIAAPEIIDYLNRVRPPFNVNTLAQQAALAALQDEEHVRVSRALNESERSRVDRALRDLGLSPVPSQANFLYFDMHGDGARFYDALLREGVIIRHLRGSLLRVTIGQPHENQRFLNAVRSVLDRERVMESKLS
ncbi:MAG: histidinol-phosphate transaminase [Nitrospirae bacterium]|nr:MAG: histidinol-phosphate transaminase [Nitrospirota bacterium]